MAQLRRTEEEDPNDPKNGESSPSLFEMRLIF